MKLRHAGAAFAILWALAAGAPASAQGAPATGASPAQTEAAPAQRTRAKRTAKKSTREPTVGQMAARERQKKCGLEWRDAKSAGKTAGQKWPQFWSQCNARLKGNQA